MGLFYTHLVAARQHIESAKGYIDFVHRTKISSRRHIDKIRFIELFLQISNAPKKPSPGGEGAPQGRMRCAAGSVFSRKFSAKSYCGNTSSVTFGDSFSSRRSLWCGNQTAR